MEHLPSPTLSADRKITIPLLERYEYDGEGFSGFPSRAGFDKERLLAGDFSEHSAEATAAFLQAWLYFGLMSSVFDQHVPLEHFVSAPGRKTITTRRLPAYIETWINKLRKKKSASPEPRIRSCLEESLMFASYVSGGLSGATTCPLSPEVSLSIMVLGSSLEAALFHAGDSIGFEYRKNRWGCSLYLDNEMVSKGWCPNDIRRLHEHGSIPLMFFASGLSRTLPQGISHNACEASECKANFIRHEDYQTRHDVDCLGCSHVGPSIESAEAILQQGGFPILKVELRHRELSLEYVKFQPPIRFCAISHVWSDGLGHATANTLPVCQIKRLYALAGDILKKSRRPWSASVPTTRGCFIWMDTLCVPRRAPFRRLAISRICTSFDSAAAVLVLDSELQKIPITVPVLELLTRVACCGWMRRVWTLLEGCLAAPALHVQFQGGSLGLADAVAKLRREWKEQTFASHALQSDVGIFYEDLTVMRLSYQRWSWSARDSHAFGFALHGFAGRATSWKGDDYLCLGIVMGLSQEAVGELSESPVEARSATILASLRNVPHGLLFCPQPKLSLPGLRWAPVDLWTARPYMTYRPATLFGADGIEVTYPGFLLPSFSFTGASFLFRDDSTGTCYRARCGADLGGTFPTARFLSAIGHVTNVNQFGIICPTNKLADDGPRTFDRVSAALVSVYKTTNRTKHVLDIGRTAVYARYICHLYLTSATAMEVSNQLSHQAGERTEPVAKAKRAPVFIKASIRKALRLQSLNKMASEYLDQT